MNFNVKACDDCKTMLYHEDKQGMNILSGAEYRRNYNVKDILPSHVRPQMHCWYQERVMDISDNLPKFADVPETEGGTGKMLNTDGSPVEG
jgi:hypothetical protein